MKKSDKLTRFLGGNVTASIKGAADCTVQETADRRFDRRKRDDGAGWIALDRIVSDPTQPRKSYDSNSLNNLADSLKQNGQVQACVVRWDAAKELYVIVAGERRYRAAKIAGLEKLRCLVWDRELDADTRFELQIIENALREDLPPVEQAAAYRELMARRGWKANVLAEKLHLHPASVTRSLALLKLPKAVRAGVDLGVISPAVGYEISKAPKDKQGVIAEAAVREKKTRDQVAQEVKGESVPLSKCTIKPAKDEPIVWQWEVSNGVKVRLQQGIRSVFGLLSVAKALREVLAKVDAEIESELREAKAG